MLPFNISAIDRNSEITYAHIEKKENGQWKRIDDTVKIKPASYDDDFVHGLTKGEYRLAIKAPTTQLNAVSSLLTTPTINSPGSATLIFTQRSLPL